MTSYTTTGINLKGSPLGESDRLITILSPDHGLLRLVAPGARKHKSRLRGRSQLFTINELWIAKGRSLDRISQAETVETYPQLSSNLGKLAAGQYLAELALGVGVIEQPQESLYLLLTEHLRRIEALSDLTYLHAYLCHGVFHLLAIAGIAPKLFDCCVSGISITPNFVEPTWRVGLSFTGGGVVDLGQWREQQLASQNPLSSVIKINSLISATELCLFQQLSQPQLSALGSLLPETAPLSEEAGWARVERLLRIYLEHHLERPIRSAALLEGELSPDF
ncbi:MAG: DNA repair protein RecO [Cyanobacteria bacterium P01_H01_bin.15]